MEWGDKAEWLIEVSQEENDPLPPAILNKPELPLYLSEVWRAFWILNSSRQSGFSIQPIQLSEIKAYFDIYGKVEDIDAFIEYIKHLDILFMKKVSKND